MKIFDTLERNGNIYYLTQEPYLTGTIEEPYYEANGFDENNNPIVIRWYDVEFTEDEDIVDWENWEVTQG